MAWKACYDEEGVVKRRRRIAEERRGESGLDVGLG